MNTLLTILGVLGGIVAFGLTILSAINFRKPRKITVVTTLLSILVSLLALLAMVLLGGLRLRGLLAIPLLLVGMLLGYLRGQAVKLSWMGRQVIGQNSILFILLWGVSLVLSLLLGMLQVPLLASLGLIPAVFSTGLQVGYYLNLFIRRLAMRRTSVQSNTAIPPYPAQPVPTSGKNRTLIFVLIGVFIGLIGLILIGYILVRSGVAGRLLAGNPAAAEEIPAAEAPQAEQVIIVVPPEDTPYAQPTQETILVPTAAALAEERLMISEQFNSQELNAIALLPIEYMDYYNAEGFGIIERLGPRALLPILFPGIQIADFVAEFDFWMPDAHDDSSCGLIFRSDGVTFEEMNNYYALFLYPGTDEIAIGLWQDNEMNYSPLIEVSPPFNSGYEINHVRLEVSGIEMIVYVNGSFVTNLSQGSHLEQGYINLFLYPSVSQPDYVMFDNLKIIEH